MSRWVRLNTTWSQSAWVAALNPAARLAWVELLCHIKAHGTEGRAKALTSNIFGRMYDLPADAVTEMLQAAQRDKALRIEDGIWILTGWSDHQGDPTAKNRMRRYRAKRTEPNGADATVTGVTRNHRNVTPTETETETITTPSPPTRAQDLEPLADYLAEHAPAVDRMAASAPHPSNWGTAVLALYGPHGTDPTIWRDVPDEERAIRLAAALDRYAGEAQPYKGNFFRAVLRDVIAEPLRAVSGGGARASPRRARTPIDEQEYNPQRWTGGFRG